MKKKKKKHKKSKYATDIRGMCLIRDNAGSNKCKLVQDFLEAETVIQLPKPPYSPDLNPCGVFLFTSLKPNFPRRRYEPQSVLYSAIFQCLQGVPKKSSNLHSELETKFLLRENTTTG